MLKICALWLLLLAQGVGASEIYKWTDENGKVHFGDQANAPKKSEEVIVKPVSGTGAMPSKYDFTTKELSKTAVENPKRSNSIDLTTPAVAKCSGLAKQYIVNDDNAEREALISKIKSMCRGVSFYCWSYKANPSRNRCEAGQTRLDGVTVEYTTNRE